MKKESLSIHGVYTTETTTKYVAIPINQTVAYEFDDAQHRADLFNLAFAGNIYTRIMNPTDTLERGVAGLPISAGMKRRLASHLTFGIKGDFKKASKIFYDALGLFKRDKY